jgi:hypothetical protein
MPSSQKNACPDAVYAMQMVSMQTGIRPVVRLNSRGEP